MIHVSQHGALEGVLHAVPPCARPHLSSAYSAALFTHLGTPAESLFPLTLLSVSHSRTRLPRPGSSNDPIPASICSRLAYLHDSNNLNWMPVTSAAMCGRYLHGDSSDLSIEHLENEKMNFWFSLVTGRAYESGHSFICTPPSPSHKAMISNQSHAATPNHPDPPETLNIL